jgi:hypothetical protein
MRVCNDPLENLLAVNRNVWWADETKSHAVPASCKNPNFNGSVNKDLLIQFSGQYQHYGSSLLRSNSIRRPTRSMTIFRNTNDIVVLPDFGQRSLPIMRFGRNGKTANWRTGERRVFGWGNSPFSAPELISYRDFR